jgi:hypothetical protein
MPQLSDNGGFKLRSALIGAVVAAALIELAAGLEHGRAPAGMATVANQSQLLLHHPSHRHDH